MCASMCVCLHVCVYVCARACAEVQSATSRARPLRRCCSLFGRPPVLACTFCLRNPLLQLRRDRPCLACAHACARLQGATAMEEDLLNPCAQAMLPPKSATPTSLPLLSGSMSMGGAGNVHSGPMPSPAMPSGSASLPPGSCGWGGSGSWVGASLHSGSADASSGMLAALGQPLPLPDDLSAQQLQELSPYQQFQLMQQQQQQQGQPPQKRQQRQPSQKAGQQQGKQGKQAQGEPSSSGALGQLNYTTLPPELLASLNQSARQQQQQQESEQPLLGFTYRPTAFQVRAGMQACLCTSAYLPPNLTSIVMKTVIFGIGHIQTKIAGFQINLGNLSRFPFFMWDRQFQKCSLWGWKYAPKHIQMAIVRNEKRNMACTCCVYYLGH